MKFTLEIDCGNAAFGESRFARSYEVARILNEVINDLIEGNSERKLFDINGNLVGDFKFYEVTA